MRKEHFDRLEQNVLKMPSVRVLIVFCVILAVCYCEPIKKKKYKHKYELYWHGFHYLTFLALKFKALVILSSIFTIGLIAGKIFAVIKFAEYMRKSSHDKHSEKIVYVSPHELADDHGPHHAFSPSGPAYGKSHGDGYNQDSFPPGYSVDQPPPGAQISDGGGNFNGFGGNYGGDMYRQPHGYGRSNINESYSIYKYLKLFKDMIKGLNVTNMAFNDMNLKSDKCRRKFVCEADVNSRESILLKSAFDMFSDENYARYKTRTNISSIDDCNEIYPNCDEGG